jgi:hypothetical protein
LSERAGALASIYGRIKARTPSSRWGDLAQKLAALVRYREAVQLAGHRGVLRAQDPTAVGRSAPFWRPGLPLGAQAEAAHKWLALGHEALSRPLLTIVQAVVVHDHPLEVARTQLGR